MEITCNAKRGFGFSPLQLFAVGSRRYSNEVFIQRTVGDRICRDGESSIGETRWCSSRDDETCFEIQTTDSFF
ncbi:unnamed protein product [Victoria cruziana]